MSWAITKDNIRLHYEEAGQGTPIVFVHEFAGDWRAWEPQMRHFSRRHRCITYSARGYLPSDVPKDVSAYSQENAVQDILAVMDAAKIERAHIVGLSMGGFATLHFGLTAPERALSLTVAGAGYAAEKSTQEIMRAKSRATADQFEKIGAKELAKTYALGPTRVQLQNKSPRGWQEFATQLGEHDSLGAANTMRGVQASRPSIYDFESQLKNMHVPTLVINGDEDDQCIAPGIFLKKTIPACGLLMLPKTGHTINLEEPDWFNLFLADFIATVEAGRWTVRDPRSLPHP
ncbi:alpha/beta fold hydrolase [Zwartia panacis]|uniref:alpha/beta fold hydrolase n=1 Tax=Zwartia panacis TaxID=2683345 RepID=UPI0025B6125A|nr:alpha/beta hydrolase [Zwartia panacis]MDN4016090.1 alpha/beta hydrolase [Zwartia panacis]